MSADRLIRTVLGFRYAGDPDRWDGSDNWPLIWANDDRRCIVYGDGYGFDGKTMYLAFLGDDNFCVRKAPVTLYG